MGTPSCRAGTCEGGITSSSASAPSPANVAPPSPFSVALAVAALPATCPARGPAVARAAAAGPPAPPAARFAAAIAAKAPAKPTSSPAAGLVAAAAARPPAWPTWSPVARPAAAAASIAAAGPAAPPTAGPASATAGPVAAAAGLKGAVGPGRGGRRWGGDGGPTRRCDGSALGESRLHRSSSCSAGLRHIGHRTWWRTPFAVNTWWRAKATAHSAWRQCERWESGVVGMCAQHIGHTTTPRAGSMLPLSGLSLGTSVSMHTAHRHPPSASLVIDCSSTRPSRHRMDGAAGTGAPRTCTQPHPIGHVRRPLTHAGSSSWISSHSVSELRTTHSKCQWREPPWPRARVSRGQLHPKSFRETISSPTWRGPWHK